MITTTWSPPRCMISRYDMFNLSLFCPSFICDTVWRFHLLFLLSIKPSPTPPTNITVADIQCTSSLSQRCFLSSFFLSWFPFITVFCVCACISLVFSLPVSYFHSGCINKKKNKTHERSFIPDEEVLLDSCWNSGKSPWKGQWWWSFISFSFLSCHSHQG